MKYIKHFEDGFGATAQIQGTRGLESSIMPYTQFNNMTKRLYPSGDKDRQDDRKNQLNNEIGSAVDVAINRGYNKDSEEGIIRKRKKRNIIKKFKKEI